MASNTGKSKGKKGTTTPDTAKPSGTNPIGGKGSIGNAKMPGKVGGGKGKK
jgi:hypothetical protein